MKKSQLKQIIKEELQKVLIEIDVPKTDPTVLKIWEEYKDQLKNEYNPRYSEYKKAYDYLNSLPKVSFSNPRNVDELVSAIKKTTLELARLLGEPEEEYYEQDIKIRVTEICEELNFAQTKELIDKLDRAIRA